jgi:hypothetical protein
MKKFFFALLAALASMHAAAQIAPPMSTAPALSPGLYVHVIDGLIRVTNPAGGSTFASGQFGYTPSFRQPPVLLPVVPALLFTPPPVFNSWSANAGGGSSPKPNAVDCEVR